MKKLLHQRQFPGIFAGETIFTKKSVMDSYFGSNMQCFQERNCRRSYPSGYCEKYHVQSTQLFSSILVKSSFG